jgi:pilus assembly protein Flp/PilA
MFDRVSRALSWAHTSVFRLQSWTQVAVLRLQHGQGLAEYALILALIAIVAIVALIFLGGKISTVLSTVGKSI